MDAEALPQLADFLGAFVENGQRQIVQPARGRVGRVVAQGLLEVREAFVKPAVQLPGDSDVVVRLGQTGVDLYGSAIALQGLLDPVAVLEELAQVVPGLREMRPHLQRPAVAGLRLAAVPQGPRRVA